MHTRHDVRVARQIGTDSDSIEVAPRPPRLRGAGTPGLAANGALPPDMTGQAEIARSHILAMLERAGMTVHHLAKVTRNLLRDADIPACATVRPRALGAPHPASTLLLLPALGRPASTLLLLPALVRPASMLLRVPAPVRPGFLPKVNCCAAAPAR
jgi:2-iminobutanoate/2-iminopropanoate deaminase